MEDGYESPVLVSIDSLSASIKRINDELPWTERPKKKQRLDVQTIREKAIVKGVKNPCKIETDPPSALSSSISLSNQDLSEEGEDEHVEIHMELDESLGADKVLQRYNTIMDHHNTLVEEAKFIHIMTNFVARQKNVC